MMRLRARALRLQALIELDEAGSEERSILEAPSSHVKDGARVIPTRQGRFAFG